MIKKVLASRYSMDHLVGEGSFSTVFKGWDKEYSRPVAIKRLKTEGLTRDEYREAEDLFFREIEFLEKMDHPAIPRYYDFVFENNHIYLIMEWVEGKTLAEILEEKGALSMKEALWYMERITEVLVYLQSRREVVIFKDLKPSNIMIDSGGRLKIIDFGTARIFSSEKERDSHALGTPGYAPPEAYKKDSQTDPSSDVYSLGATFYHLTTGQEPFQFKFSFPAADKYNSSLSPEFSQMLLDCLKIKKEERIPNAEELRRRLTTVNPPLFDFLYSIRRNFPEVLHVTLWYVLINIIIVFAFAAGVYALHYEESQGLLPMLNSLIYFSVLSFIVIFTIYNLILIISSKVHR